MRVIRPPGRLLVLFSFFLNHTPTPEIYTLSLHDVFRSRLGSDGGWADILTRAGVAVAPLKPSNAGFSGATATPADRKSTRLNSSHTVISYAVFCLKKKKEHDDSLPQNTDCNDSHISRIC